MSEDSAAKSIQLLADQGYPPNAINNRRMDNPATAIESDDSERWEDFFGKSHWIFIKYFYYKLYNFTIN